MLRNSRVLVLCAVAAFCLLVPALGLAQENSAAPTSPAAISQSATAALSTPATHSQEPAATPDLAALFQKPVRPVVACNQFACGHELMTNCTEVCGDLAFCWFPPASYYGHCIYQ